IVTFCWNDFVFWEKKSYNTLSKLNHVYLQDFIFGSGWYTLAWCNQEKAELMLTNDLNTYSRYTLQNFSFWNDPNIFNRQIALLWKQKGLTNFYSNFRLFNVLLFHNKQ